MDTMVQVCISAANWTPLSAAYSYDTNLDFQPTLIEWRDGYTLMHHPLFEGSKDIALNRYTSFCLTSAGSFFDFIRERQRDEAYLGAYVTFKYSDGYITTINDELILSACALSQNNFYRLFVNSDNTVSFLQGDSLYVTVQNEMPHKLYLEEQLSVGEIGRQKFNVYTPDNNTIYLTTNFDNPNPGYGPDKIERFWSFSSTTSAIRAVGLIADDDYAGTHDYIFEVIGYDIVFPIKGMIRDQTWVHYYNEQFEKSNNRNTELSEGKCISGVKINRLIDLPYTTGITINTDVGTMSINLANLKNVMTPEYEYTLRTQYQPPVED